MLVIVLVLEIVVLTGFLLRGRFIPDVSDPLPGPAATGTDQSERAGRRDASEHAGGQTDTDGQQERGHQPLHGFHRHAGEPAPAEHGTGPG